MNERRRFKRFELELPMTLVRAGGRPIGTPTTTQNLSSGGVLFSTDAAIEVGQPIEYQIALPGSPEVEGGIRLRCLGKVVRLASRQNRATGSAADRQTAATLERYEFLRG